MKAPGTAYDDLLSLVGDNDYFVLTTNVDHQFQLVGFDRRRLFYTQGDYGLLQCSQPCHKRTYDNEPLVRDMIEAQGWQISASGALTLPAGTRPAMDVPAELVPHCPVCGRPMAMNLRSDDTFVEDEGWHAAAARYQDFLRRHQRGRVLYLELGVGWNTPVIVKFPFWQAVEKNPRATYACVNLGEAVAPSAIERRSVLVDADIASALRASRFLTGAALASIPPHPQVNAMQPTGPSRRAPFPKIVRRREGRARDGAPPWERR